MYKLTPPELELLKNCLLKEAEHCRMWEKAIEQVPRIAGFYKKFSEFRSGEWAVILAYIPELADMAPLQQFSTREWIYLLANQPQLAAKCKKELTAEDKENIRQLRKLFSKQD